MASRLASVQELDDETDETAVAPRPQPSAYIAHADSLVDEFLTDDDGMSLLGPSDESHEPTVQKPSLFRTITSVSVATVDSVAPHLANGHRGKSMPLLQFCQLIDQCASLERATIMSVECYRERSILGVLHRTLLFHLHRVGRQDVWLRLDRLRAKNVSIPALALRLGKTDANDVVSVAAQIFGAVLNKKVQAQLSGTKEDLLKRSGSKVENRIEFSSPPTLGVFRFCLQVICEELVEYHVWPEHLLEVGKGTLVRGDHVHLSLAPNIRTEVRSRVYHLVPAHPAGSIADNVGSTASSADFYVPQYRTLDGDVDFREFDCSALGQYIDGLANSLVEHLRHFSPSNPNPHTTTTSTISRLFRRALSLEFLLLQQEPTRTSTRLTETFFRSFYLADVRFPFIRLHLLKFEIERYNLNSDENWRDAVNHIARLARTVSRNDVPFCRACFKHLASILARHAVGKMWSDSHILPGNEDPPLLVAFSSYGAVPQILSASVNYTVTRWWALDRTKAERTVHIQRNGLLTAIAVSPDGEQILTASGPMRSLVEWWDGRSGRVSLLSFHSWEHNHVVTCIVISADEERFVTVSSDGVVNCASFGPGEWPKEPLRGHRGAMSVALSRDGKRMVTGSRHGTLRIWDALGGKTIGEEMRGHTRAVNCVCFSPDSKLVASGSWDETVRVWDVLERKRVGSPFRGHTDWIETVAFSPDGLRVASGSRDCTIRLWDALTGSPLGLPLEGHTAAVVSLAFSPDGRQLVSGSKDGTVRIWDSLVEPDWVKDLE